MPPAGAAHVLIDRAPRRLLFSGDLFVSSRRSTSGKSCINCQKSVLIYKGERCHVFESAGGRKAERHLTEDLELM